MRECVAFVAVCATLVGAAGCSGAREPAPAPAPVQEVRGTERLSWDQAAASAEAVKQLTFVAFVDGAPSDLKDVSCGTTPGPAGYPCTSPLPAMTPGRHTVQIAARAGGAGSGMLQSPLTPSLTVVLKKVE